MKWAATGTRRYMQEKFVLVCITRRERQTDSRASMLPTGSSPQTLTATYLRNSVLWAGEALRSSTPPMRQADEWCHFQPWPPTPPLKAVGVQRWGAALRPARPPTLANPRIFTVALVVPIQGAVPVHPGSRPLSLSETKPPVRHTPIQLSITPAAIHVCLHRRSRSTEERRWAELQPPTHSHHCGSSLSASTQQKHSNRNERRSEVSGSGAGGVQGLAQGHFSRADGFQTQSTK